MSTLRVHLKDFTVVEFQVSRSFLNHVTYQPEAVIVEDDQGVKTTFPNGDVMMVALYHGQRCG